MYCDFSYEGFEVKVSPRTSDTTSQLGDKRSETCYMQSDCLENYVAKVHGV